MDAFHFKKIHEQKQKLVSVCFIDTGRDIRLMGQRLKAVYYSQ